MGGGGGRYLDDGHPGADVDEQVGEDVRVGVLEAELGVAVLGVDERLVGDVPQHKVAAPDQTRHLILLVHSDHDTQSRGAVTQGFQRGGSTSCP